MPVQAATGQAYGQAKAQLEAQRAVPVAPPPAATPMGDPAPVQGAPGPPVPLDAPTGRPGEPLTAGAALGPGPGPDVLPRVPEGVDPDLANLAKQLPILELMASQPTASVQFRNFVRRVRGAVPPTLGQ